MTDLVGSLGIAGGALVAAFGVLCLAQVLATKRVDISGAGGVLLLAVLGPLLLAAGGAVICSGWHFMHGAYWARVALELLAWLWLPIAIVLSRVFASRKMLVLLVPSAAMIAALHWP